MKARTHYHSGLRRQNMENISRGRATGAALRGGRDASFREADADDSGEAVREDSGLSFGQDQAQRGRGAGASGRARCSHKSPNVRLLSMASGNSPCSTARNAQELLPRWQRAPRFHQEIVPPGCAGVARKNPRAKVVCLCAQTQRGQSPCALV